MNMTLNNDTVSKSILSHTPDILPPILCDVTFSNTPKKYEQPNQCNGNNLITPSLFCNAIKSQRGLKLIHFNARSLKGVNSCNIDQLRILLDDKFIDILAVSETWFNSTISDDVSGGGGFVTLYVKSTIPHANCSELTDNVESVWVTINLAGRASFNVCSFYRAPSSTIDYFNDMICNFESAMTHSEIVILGDFNYNYVLDETLDEKIQLISLN